MASLDDKSGYDRILLKFNSRQYFGIQFAAGIWCSTPSLSVSRLVLPV
jgi:hypothetical protein